VAPLAVTEGIYKDVEHAQRLRVETKAPQGGHGVLASCAGHEIGEIGCDCGKPSGSLKYTSTQLYVEYELRACVFPDAFKVTSIQ